MASDGTHIIGTNNPDPDFDVEKRIKETDKMLDLMRDAAEKWARRASFSDKAEDGQASADCAKTYVNLLQARMKLGAMRKIKAPTA